MDHPPRGCGIDHTAGGHSRSTIPRIEGISFSFFPFLSFFFFFPIFVKILIREIRGKYVQKFTKLEIIPRVTFTREGMK